MPPAESIYTCRDIREKVVAYTRALQHWAEQNNLPAGGGPQSVAESVLELREEVKWYLSFTDEEVFQGMALLKKEEEGSPQTLLAADIPEAHHAPEPAPEEIAPKCLGWEKVLHPSQPVVATGEIPQATRSLRLKVGSSQLSQMIPIKPPASPLKTPTPPQPSLPTQALVLMWLLTPLHGFSRVTTCLWMPELIEVDFEVPVGAMPIGLVAIPLISGVSSSHIVKDEITGITYMDTITTSIGRVAISSPDLEAFPAGPTIEDVTDCQ